MDDGERVEVEAHLRKQIEAYHEAALLFAAVASGLPDFLSLKGPAAPEMLAGELGLQPGPLRRFLRGLATMRLCDELGDGRYALTPAGVSLTSRSASSLREKVVVATGQYWLPWLRLSHSLQTGEPAFPQVYGTTAAALRAQADEGAAFHRYLAKEEMAGAADDLIKACAAADANTFASIGGGYGAFLLPVLQALPNTEGVVFDAPAVVESAAPLFEALGLKERVTFVGGDILKEIPVAAEVSVLKAVLQQHSDDDARTILENCRKTMSPNATLLVLDQPMPDHALDDPAAIMADLHMMTITGGRLRTEGELEALIAQAGFTVARSEPTAGGLSMIVCAPA
jgi:hypothetical protein